MAVTKKLALWVFNALQHNYTHKELAYNHILVFLQNQSQNYNFAIRTKVYTSSETGQPSLLLNLYGSISLGDSIQAPVEIWIPYNYPSGFSSPSNSYNSTGNVNGQSDPLFDANGSVPIVYIIPDHSKNYYLRAGNYVDTSGRFYHPYLASWYQESSSHPSNPNAPISARYELLQLIKVVAEALRAEPPIYSIYEASSPQAIMQPQASGSQQSSNYQSGPSLPPQIPISHNQNQPIKPQSPLQQQNASPGYNSATPVYDSVPERYRSPPSLPSEQSYQNNYQTVDIRSPSESPRYTPKPAYVRQVREQPSYSPSPNSLGQMHISPISHAPPVDLLSDGTDGPSTDTASNAERRQVLEQLSAKFNLFLNDAYNDNIDNSLPKVRETHQKVEALYSQLSHIYQQAVENSRSLDGHIAYLTQQVNNITILNQDLVKLDEINSESPDSVTTAPGTKTPLDNLIIPDSPLVRQLYETVSEIKAVRDTINLVSGSFHSEKELINDARMDLCVKTVRNLGRELFWLELTKQEIAHNIMGLSSN
ncbi:putative ubiquitin receptor implicated in vacuolar targeting of plasma membrane proteins [Scheffersomyces stipitis CBS 6054]|uniref:Putative ubiquitin receptor implicated in vacuolar targeting of plasma membrane proteins n=1 Tax=Scheffersomyces stipitis (strain ATCC 58785 / CBS 6054 / NBRC 10063 / NRRL Y-11545) TaxID=322104 RepID=A3GFP8_PICST|nr:putative ubiquitin receptor implicated in vacuolar targeting of plasma membrane proteins [Scheffersomyces stipitis CBS 6054]EAZ63793.2 putative ubiquitin receptor implicated in vacuolar targeting of plasma membrane proteins [Scheffersomyces stipitis CBS 6054]